MDRRRFLALAGLGAGAVLLPGPAAALLNCQDFPEQATRQCEAGIASEVMQATAKAVGSQHMEQWCWAACIEMVFHYYGHRVPQERIVTETWGGIENLPADNAVMLKTLNRVWTDEQGKRFRVTGDSYSANVVTASQDLSENMPLILGTMNHAVVLTSLLYWCSDWNGSAWGQCGITSAVVRDPWPGRGRRILSPQEWMSVSFLARIRVQDA